MTVPRWLFVVCTLSLLSSFSTAMKFEDWHCGYDNETRIWSWKLISSGCPQSKEKVNHCCVIHDDCYVKQFGQDRCDREFYECNKRTIALTNGTSGCAGHFEGLCEILLPFAGFFAYANSVGWKEPADLKLYTIKDKRFQESYSKVYANCTDQNTTISSCAYNLNKCFKEKRSEYLCSLDLVSCLADVGSKSRFPNCLLETTHMIDFVRKEIPYPAKAKVRTFPEFDLIVQFIMDNFVLYIMCVLASLVVFLLMTFIYRSYNKRKVDKYSMETIKYAAVA